MDNKKLYKFLYKDISEIEELFAEKGAVGFDDLEMEFIRARFNGARNIIQLLSEKDIKSPEVQNTQLSAEGKNDSSSEKPEAVASAAPVAELTNEEKEGLKALEEFEAEIAETKKGGPEVIEETAEEQLKEDENETVSLAEETRDEDVDEVDEPEVVESLEETTEKEEVKEDEPVVDEVPEEEEIEEKEEASTRIGDRPIASKSVNDLLGGKEDGKLEYKISNSPVKSIQEAIGINDRYQYIRELFDGNADTYTKTVGDLDTLTNIQEAVEYLQQNFKWKKNETSLKFVGLVKRRFPNG
ncbi:hypothetical protein [uncultured Draconibacterium sp.]|uniref:hypothetical protein n=1 Tax=uncultured Draconibacterium sp. TaxID=1573823 RepID=UPI002AA7F60D|nr:hypothetical protein [uncultured Draconibacterium sp.]